VTGVDGHLRHIAGMRQCVSYGGISLPCERIANDRNGGRPFPGSIVGE